MTFILFFFAVNTCIIEENIVLTSTAVTKQNITSGIMILRMRPAHARVVCIYITQSLLQNK